MDTTAQLMNIVTTPKSTPRTTVKKTEVDTGSDRSYSTDGAKDSGKSKSFSDVKKDVQERETVKPAGGSRKKDENDPGYADRAWGITGTVQGVDGLVAGLKDLLGINGEQNMSFNWGNSTFNLSAKTDSSVWQLDLSGQADLPSAKVMDTLQNMTGLPLMNAEPVSVNQFTNINGSTVMPQDVAVESEFGNILQGLENMKLPGSANVRTEDAPSDLKVALKSEESGQNPQNMLNIQNGKNQKANPDNSAVIDENSARKLTASILDDKWRPVSNSYKDRLENMDVKPDFEREPVKLKINKKPTLHFEETDKQTGDLQSAGKAGNVAEKATTEKVPEVPRDNFNEFVTARVKEFFPQGEDGAKTVKVVVNPPNLGEVKVVLQMKDGVLNTTFQCAPEAGREISNTIQQLHESLAGAGIQLGNSNVDTNTANSDRDDRKQSKAQSADEVESVGQGASVADMMSEYNRNLDLLV